MNVRATLTAIVALAAIGVGADSVMGATVSLQSKNKVKGDCAASGGVYFPSSKTTKTWGCMNSDNSGIVCGGATKAQKNSCSTFRQAPQPGRLPTRKEALKAENN